MFNVKSRLKDHVTQSPIYALDSSMKAGVDCQKHSAIIHLALLPCNNTTIAATSKNIKSQLLNKASMGYFMHLLTNFS